MSAHAWLGRDIRKWFLRRAIGTPVASSTLPFSALLAATVCYASLAATGKLAVADLDPLLVAGVRILVGALFLGGFAVARGMQRVARRDLTIIGGLGLLGVVINQTLFLEGVSRTSATNASILIATIPLFTMVIALSLRQERATWQRAAGILVAFVGVAFLVADDAFRVDRETTIGNIMILLNSLSYSAYLVASRPILARYGSSTVVAWTFVLASIVMAPVVVVKGAAAQFEHVGSTAWAALASVVLVGTVLAYGFNNYALKRLDASTVASYVFLHPLIGVGLAVTLAGEAPGLKVLGAGLVVVVGVVLASRATRLPMPPADAGTIARRDDAGKPQPEPTYKSPPR